MFTTIFLGVLLFALVVLLIVPGVRLFALIPLGLLLVVGSLSIVTTVEAKQVGVLTTFGKPSERTLPSGLHFKAPWQKVTDIDATVQTDEYRGDDCITVILADKNTACISATNRWSVSKENANDVYADFRSDDPTKNLRDAVVSTEFKAAVFDAFGDYDATQEAAADTAALAKEVKDALLVATDGLVNIERVTISYIKPGEKVQDKIDAIQAQVAQTTIATEKKITAEKEAAANRELSDSISNDPNVLVSKCLDLISDGSLVPPAGFSCWPGGGGGVVIPGTK